MTTAQQGDATDLRQQLKLHFDAAIACGELADTDVAYIVDLAADVAKVHVAAEVANVTNVLLALEIDADSSRAAYEAKCKNLSRELATLRQQAADNAALVERLRAALLASNETMTRAVQHLGCDPVGLLEQITANVAMRVVARRNSNCAAAQP